MMDLRQFERELMESVPDFNERLKWYSDTELACSAISGGQMLCCWGIIQIWPGLAEGWLLTSNQIEGYAVSLTRGARRYFKQVATELKLNRLQITVNSRNIVAIRWADALGFEREGRLRNYGPSGDDYFMYARVFK